MRRAEVCRIGATALHPHYQPNPYRETGDQA